MSAILDVFCGIFVESDSEIQWNAILCGDVRENGSSLKMCCRFWLMQMLRLYEQFCRSKELMGIYVRDCGHDRKNMV